MLVDRTFNRRGFLKGALAVGGAAAFQGLNLLDTNGRIEAAPGSGGYGPLGPVKDLRDGVERISLPEGFSYRSFGVGGTPMTRDGLTPLAHDGMAVFNMPNGRFRLVRNHEDRNGATSGNQSVGGDASKKYDGRGGGGTTTLVVNPFTRTLEEDWVSLNGTIVNCAGGATPWGTWITCEETNAGTSSSWLQQHGYCFEVPVTANSTVAAVPLPDMGRFAHEAVAVDPGSKIVYETEDNGDTSGFYRFLANTPGQLINGGRLQMLAIAGQSNYDTRTGETVGVKLPVVWVDIATRTPRARTRRPCSTRALRGAAPASRDSRAAGTATTRSTSTRPTAAKPGGGSLAISAVRRRQRLAQPCLRVSVRRCIGLSR